MILTKGRIDVDEPLRVLSRGAYKTDTKQLGERLKNVEMAKSLSSSEKLQKTAEGLASALQNLHSDFDLIGIMEDMDAFLVKVALTVRWDPVQFAYKPARVRENAAMERHHHTTADKCNVRAKHLSSEVLSEIERVVADESILYSKALELHKMQNKKLPGFDDGLKALKTANSALFQCSQRAIENTG